MCSSPRSSRDWCISGLGAMRKKFLNDHSLTVAGSRVAYEPITAGRLLGYNRFFIYFCAVTPTESDDMAPSLYGLSIEEEIR